MIKYLDTLVSHLENELVGMPIRLWLVTLEGSGNIEYWTRRGFNKIGAPYVVPGRHVRWTSAREFVLQNMNKTLS